MKKENSSLNRTNDSGLTLRQVMNKKDGLIFEENIRRTLEYNYSFKKKEYLSSYFTKKIIFNNNKESINILQDSEKKVRINKKDYIITFNKKFELLIKNENGELLQIIKGNESNREIHIKLDETLINIQPHKEFGIDGLFEINNYSVNQFDKNEVSILYSNINKNDENKFKFAVIESKLSHKKINELIKQIIKDSELLKVMDKKDSLILGFINSDIIKNESHFNNLKNINCVIYGIKNSILCGKNITYQIDWDLNSKVKHLEQNINELKPKVDYIYNYIKEISEKKERKEIEDNVQENIEKNNEIKDINKKEKVVRKEKEKNDKAEVKEEKEEKIKERSKLLLGRKRQGN